MTLSNHGIMNEVIVDDLANRIRFMKPYYLRVSNHWERIYFPKRNEIGVYSAFFDVGLRFSLDDNLRAFPMHCIFHYFDTPL